MTTAPRASKTKEAPRKRAKGSKAKASSPEVELISVFADIVARRVEQRISVSKTRSTEPVMVPVWLADPRPRKRGRVSVAAGAPIEDVFHAAGLVTEGDPGYEEAVKKYLAWKAEHEAELAVRADLRRAARLLVKVLAGRT